ncbi:MAG TPA: HAMP domain-containing sensor histidine kinase [Candidatus Limnocylindria bacterium]
MSRRFARRAGCFVLAVVVMLVVVVATIIWLLTTLVGQGWFSALLAIAVILALAFILRGISRGVRLSVAPMGDLIDASERIEAGDVGTQVEVRGPREIRAMGRAFNSMSARLAADTDARRKLLADVSHELRTPLSIIQGNVEGMIDGLYPADRPHLERVLAETRQLERLIEDLRTLSLADAGELPLHREPVALGDLVADVVAGFQAQSATAGVTLRVEATDAPTIDLDPRRIRQVIGNLLSNALRHTPSGGAVTVSVRQEANAVILEVADSGAGMDPESAVRAFDRFWRAGDTAGAGIGLAIVRDLVRAHGGEATLESELGRGTTVRCRFPDRPGGPGGEA